MKVEQRADGKFCVKNGFSRIKVVIEYMYMTNAYGDAAPKQNAVYRWFKGIEEGRETLNYDERSGRQQTLTSFDVAVIKELLDKDRRIILRELHTGLRRHFLRVMRKKRAEDLPRIIFHQDNTLSHQAATTQHTIDQLGIQILDHPPYSPDLSPCDLLVSRREKLSLRDTVDDTDELSFAVQAAIANISVEISRECFVNSCIQRCRKCIMINTELFEKD